MCDTLLAFGVPRYGVIRERDLWDTAVPAVGRVQGPQRFWFQG